MKLSAEQSVALDAIRRWLTSADPFFILAGYAGTGKTTLLQAFVNGQDSLVTCLAPTGKAASVLQKKLDNARVSTVHKALYNPVTPSLEKLEQLEEALINHPENEELRAALEEEKARIADRGISFNLKMESTIHAGMLVVVDESSMCTDRMFCDLMETGAKILFVGDAGQLPPPRDVGFFDKHRPDVSLEQVHRQALESEIVRVSMRVRNGEEVYMTRGEQFTKMPKLDLPGEEWLPFDQVITGRNDSRRKINRYFRGKAGRMGWWPNEGERLICLKNDTSDGIGYINGVQATALNNFEYNDTIGDLLGEVLYEGELCPMQGFYRYPFKVHYDPAAVEDPWHSRHGLREFDYAYAITVHKSQGSEWDRVLLADDQLPGGAEFRRKWLYTAVTRARKELVWLI